MEHLGCSNKKAVGLLRELDEKADLIERRRQGQGRPSLIYVKTFMDAWHDDSGSVGSSLPAV